MPTDPVTSVLTAVAGKAAVRGLNSMLGPENTPRARLQLTEADGLFMVTKAQGEALGIFTQAQLMDIDKFLASAEVSAIIESLLVLKVLNREPVEELDEPSEALYISFCDLADSGRRTPEASHG